MSKLNIHHQSTAHDAVYFKAKILHRDISVGKILIDEDGNGFFIEWNLYVRISDDPPCARRAQRTVRFSSSSALLSLSSHSRGHGSLYLLRCSVNHSEFKASRMIENQLYMR